MKEKIKKFVMQVIRFWIAGGICLAIDCLGLIFLREVCGVNYLVASGISYTASVVVNYFISKSIVFESKNKMNTKEQFIVFVILRLVGLGLNEVIMWVATSVIGLYYIVSKVIEVCIVAVWNFTSRKRLLE